MPRRGWTSIDVPDCMFSVGRDRQRKSGQRRSASQPFHSHLRSVTSSSPHSRPGLRVPMDLDTFAEARASGGRYQRSRRERSHSQFFEGSSPRHAGAVSGAPCGPAHRGDSGVHRASDEAHPGSPRRGDQSPGSCRCRDCKASQGNHCSKERHWQVFSRRRQVPTKLLHQCLPIWSTN